MAHPIIVFLVVVKVLEFVMKMSISSGLVHVLENTSSIDEKITSSASLRAPLMLQYGGM
jgi:hypothetical protein